MRLPLPLSLKSHAIVGFVCFFIGAALGFFGPSCADRKTAGILPSIDSQVAQHEVKTEAPVLGLDKQELRRRSVISRKIVDNKTAEVLATGQVRDSSGSRTVAAVLDTKTGDTRLFQKRPFSEWMHSNTLGLGVGYGSEGLRKEFFYRHKFARLWEFYPAFGAAIGRNETDRTDWLLRIDLTYEW
jgi:hypothetical protein